MTMRTRSVPGSRLFERLSARAFGRGRAGGSMLLERLGFDDPWGARTAFGGFNLVYLTLPLDDEPGDEAEDESLESLTARDLLARSSRRVPGRAKAASSSSRRRLLSRLADLNAERPSVARRMSRGRSSLATRRPLHAAAMASGFIYAEPQAEVPVEADVEPEATGIWGRSAQRQHAEPASRTRVVPATLPASAGRIEAAPSPVGERARVSTKRSTSSGRRPSPMTGWAGRDRQPSAQEARRGASPIDRALASVTVVPQAHEARQLAQAAARIQGSAARELRRAIARVESAPAGRRERIVRQALRDLPPAVQRSVSVQVASSPRTGASPVASVAARFEGIGRGQRSLRPTVWSSPSLVPLTFEEPAVEVPEPADSGSRSPRRPSTGRPRRSLAPAARAARTQQTASRAGPRSASAAVDESMRVAPPTERVARRAASSSAAAALPTVARGTQAMAPAPSRGAVARVIRRVEGTVQRSVAAASSRTGVRSFQAGDRARQVGVRPGAPSASAGPFARAPLSGGYEVPTSRSSAPIARAGHRAGGRSAATRSRALFQAPTSYVHLAVESDLSAAEPESAPSGAAATDFSAAPSGPARSVRRAEVPASTTRTQQRFSAAPASVPVRRVVEAPTVRAAQRLNTAVSSADALNVNPIASTRRVSRPSVQSLQVTAPAQARVSRSAGLRSTARAALSTPTARVAQRAALSARDASGSLRLAPSRTSHVIRQARVFTPSTTVLEPAHPVVETDSATVAPNVGPDARRRTRGETGQAAATVSAARASTTPPMARAALRAAAPVAKNAVESPISSYVEDRRPAAGHGVSGREPAAEMTTSAVQRAERRGESLTALTAQGTLWHDRSPMAHIESRAAVSSSDAALVEPGPTAARLTTRGTRSVASASPRRARVSGPAQTVLEPVEPAVDVDGSVAPTTPTTPTGAAAVAATRRSAPVAPDVVADRPALRAAKRSLVQARTDARGRLESRPAVVRGTGRRPTVSASRPLSSSQGAVKRPSHGRGAAASGVTPALRASMRASGRGVARRRSTQAAVLPYIGLERELVAGDIDSSATAVEADARRAARPTQRAAVRTQAPVRVDGRGVGQVVRRPAAYVGLDDASTSMPAADRLARRGGVPGAARLTWSPTLSVLVPELVARGESGADPSAGVAGRPAVGRAVSPGGRRRPLRLADPGTVLEPAPVLVESVEQVQGSVSARQDPQARRRVVTRVRDVRAGPTAWATARAAATLPTTGRPTTELGRALRAGRRVAVAPARFAALAGNLAWLEPTPTAPSADEPAAVRRAAGPRVSSVARSGGAIGTTLDGAASPAQAEAQRVPNTVQMVQRAQRHAARATGTRRRPFTNAAAATPPARRRAGQRAPEGVLSPAGAATRGQGSPHRARRRAASAPEATFASYAPTGDTDELPAWARRDASASTVGDREHTIGERASLRADHSVVNAIARASSPEEIVRLVTDGKVSREQLRRSLPGPAVKLVERIVTLEQVARNDQREQARHVMGLRMRGTAPEVDFVSRKRPASSLSAGAPRQFLPVASAQSMQGLGASRVTHLANKLLNLIHLAEVDQRVSDAQQHVRMSDSEVGGGGAGGSESSVSANSANVQALKRDVFDAVLDRLGELKNRSSEDPDGHSMWW